MKLNIDQEAVDLIRQKGGHATVSVRRLDSCCVGGLFDLQVEFGPPRRPLSAYQVIQADGATIYLDRAMDWVEKTYRLHVTRFLRFQTLAVTAEGD